MPRPAYPLPRRANTCPHLAAHRRATCPHTTTCYQPPILHAHTPHTRAPHLRGTHSPHSTCTLRTAFCRMIAPSFIMQTIRWRGDTVSGMDGRCVTGQACHPHLSGLDTAPERADGLLPPPAVRFYGSCGGRPAPALHTVRDIYPSTRRAPTPQRTTGAPHLHAFPRIPLLLPRSTGKDEKAPRRSSCRRPPRGFAIRRCTCGRSRLQLPVRFMENGRRRTGRHGRAACLFAGMNAHTPSSTLRHTPRRTTRTHPRLHAAHSWPCSPHTAILRDIRTHYAHISLPAD